MGDRAILLPAPGRRSRELHTPRARLGPAAPAPGPGPRPPVPRPPGQPWTRPLRHAGQRAGVSL